MARKLTVKQDKFCMAYVETGNASEAYRQAYPRSVKWKPESVNRKAFEMLGNVKIMSRVEALQKEHAERHNVTMDSITEELEVARLQALNANQNTAAIQASMGKARLHGLLIDKKDITVNQTVSESTTDELLREYVKDRDVDDHRFVH